MLVVSKDKLTLEARLSIMQSIKMFYDYNIPMLLRYVEKIETILEVQGFLMNHILHIWDKEFIE